MSARTPRILALLGSGETAPTMVGTHREVVSRLGERVPRAVLLDTPYGFQENASEISQRAIEYFAKSVQLPIEVAGYPGPLAVEPDTRSPLAEASALSRLRTANLIFAGPGSPSYALSAWRTSPVPEALATVLADGGAVVFSSAAALTLGRFCVPVYEIYKVGHPVHWLDGLDLLTPLGFGASCVVLPHYDNSEGGTHDTRFCYLGQRRLDAMEALLPEDAWVLGIDEHTSLVIDLDTGQATVMGRGGLTIRHRGASHRFLAGQPLTLDELLSAARDAAPSPTLTRGTSGPSAESRPASQADGGAPAHGGAPRSPLLTEVTRIEQNFEAAVAGRRAAEAAEAILNLDRTILEWSADTIQSDDPDRARAVLYSLVQRLGEAASMGLRDPREALSPLVENLITLRAELRAAKAWELADRVRDRLLAAGIEIRDTPAGTVWELKAVS